MPFGLSGAVAEFTRLMQRVLGPLQEKTVRNYLDDVVIDWPDLLVKIELVLGKLKDAKLTLKPAKCLFGTTQIEFLGFIVGGGKIRPSRAKNLAVTDYPVPTDVYLVIRFLGLASFFRRFISSFAVVAEPLYAVNKEGERV